MGQALYGLGLGVSQPRLQPRHIQLCRRQQGAQLVVQFSRQMAALIFTYVLQVGCQLGQVGGALPHLQIKLVTLPFEGLLFSNARVEQCPRLQ